MGVSILLCWLLAGPSTDGGLHSWQPLVGQWRGVGQVRRGSNDGAWRVDAAWKWDFRDAAAESLVYHAADGKYLKAARLRVAARGENQAPSEQPPLELLVDDVVFRQVLPAGKPSAAASSQLVFEAEKPLPSGLARISMRLVAQGDRLVVDLERRTSIRRFTSLGMLGFTREGSRFGQGASYVECVVTGGKGTIPVIHAGVTYYVCCTGCKDYFEQDPESVLADYRKRREEQQREKQQRDEQRKPESPSGDSPTR